MGWNISEFDTIEGQKIMDSLSNLVKQILNYNAKYGDQEKLKIYKEEIQSVKTIDEIFGQISIMIDDQTSNLEPRKAKSDQQR